MSVKVPVPVAQTPVFGVDNEYNYVLPPMKLLKATPYEYNSSKKYMMTGKGDME